MPRKLAKVTRQDAVEAAASHAMDTIYSAIGTTVLVAPCLAAPPEDNHYCFYNRMVEKGWLERVFTENAPPGAGFLKTEAADAWCTQFLKKSFEEGPIVDLINETFDRAPQDLKDWIDIVREQRIVEAL